MSVDWLALAFIVLIVVLFIMIWTTVPARP